MIKRFCISPDCDPTQHRKCGQSNCPICEYEIRTVDLEFAKTFSTIYKPNKNEQQILQDKGFRLRSVNGNFYIYEKDEGYKR